MGNRLGKHEIDFGRPVESRKRDNHITEINGNEEDKKQHRYEPVE